CTDEQVVNELQDEAFDAGERDGRVELHRDDADAALVNDPSDRLHLVRLDPPNDRDQRASVEIMLQQLLRAHRSILLAISLMPARKHRSPSSSTASRLCSATAAA